MRLFLTGAHFAVQTSGNDVFYRNPYNVEENLFVNLSSPSSSKFTDVTLLGSPEEAAKRLLNQTLDEFMSTRIGSRKEADIVSFSQREAGGRLYYDIEVWKLICLSHSDVYMCCHVIYVVNFSTCLHSTGNSTFRCVCECNILQA